MTTKIIDSVLETKLHIGGLRRLSMPLSSRSISLLSTKICQSKVLFRYGILQQLKDVNHSHQMSSNGSGEHPGAIVTFKLTSNDTSTHAKPPLEAIEAFTSRPDTIFGAMYLALALNHPLSSMAAQSDPDLQTFVESANSNPPESNTAYLLKHVSAFNPVRELRAMAAFPAHNLRAYIYKPMPIFVSPYVGIASKTTLAVMGVPAHATLDHAFWRQNIGDSAIPTVISKVKPGDKELPINKVKFLTPGAGDKPFTEKGVLNALCGPFAGLSSDDAIHIFSTRIPGISLLNV